MIWNPKVHPSGCGVAAWLKMPMANAAPASAPIRRLCHRCTVHRGRSAEACLVTNAAKNATATVK